MREKRKWFNPKPPPELLQESFSGSDVSEEAARELLSALSRQRTLKAGAAFREFSVRASMPPAGRLSHNLHVLLGILANRRVTSVIPDGLTTGEHDALAVLHAGNFPVKARETAHALLNVCERQLLARTVDAVFRRKRSENWEMGRVQCQTTARSGA